jgi:cyclopropane fatty-acyl-phospholipid synthase-like methyltransferase
MPKAAQNFPDKDSLSQDKGIDLEVCQCIGCGLVQLNNEPVSYYKDVIRAAAYSEEMKEFRLKQFDNFIKKYNLKNKNIVEIGCGKGEYLSLMDEFNINTYGIEHSQESVDYCINEGLNVSKMYLENPNDIINKNFNFDAFFILNFFEHLVNPSLTLKILSENLNDDAVGIIEVPNFDMMLKNNLFSEFINDHLFYFTKETLTSTLSKNGFEIIELNEVWHDYIISAVVKKRKNLDLTHFKHYQNKMTNELTKYINNFENVAIWGASHQGISVMALTQIQSKIKYVIDDAPFKQGKYTHATHIPIVSSKKLKTDPVDAIIVMAASYSDEVVKKIKLKFDKNIKISILRDHSLEII